MTQHIYALVKNVPLGTPSEVSAASLPDKCVMIADAFAKVFAIKQEATLAFLTEKLGLSPERFKSVEQSYSAFRIQPSFYQDAGKMQYLMENSDAAKDLAQCISGRRYENPAQRTSYFSSN